MEPAFAVLIHKSNTHYLPTNLPAQFYGMPDGKVMIVYARFYDVKFERTGVEYVYAIHKEFEFDYANRKIIPLDWNSRRPISNEMVDKASPQFEIKNVRRNLNSFSQAYVELNKMAKEIHDQTLNQVVLDLKADSTDH